MREQHNVLPCCPATLPVDSKKMLRICSTDELPGEDTVREFSLPTGRRICIANVGGKLYAIDNVCPHQGAALGQGTVEQGYVVCPWHGWQIHPDSGVAEQDSSCMVQRYAIEIRGDDVMLDV
jgi:nitrite reductase (NADH) small subunit